MNEIMMSWCEITAMYERRETVTCGQMNRVKSINLIERVQKA